MLKLYMIRVSWILQGVRVYVLFFIIVLIVIV